MKVAGILLFVFLAFVVEGSFGKRHGAKHVTHKPEHEDPVYDEEEGDWPEVSGAKNFEVPEGFTASPPPHDINGLFTSSSGKHHHGKRNQKTMTTHHY